MLNKRKWIKVIDNRNTVYIPCLKKSVSGIFNQDSGILPINDFAYFYFCDIAEVKFTQLLLNICDEVTFTDNHYPAFLYKLFFFVCHICIFFTMQNYNNSSPYAIPFWVYFALLPLIFLIDSTPVCNRTHLGMAHADFLY